MESHRHGLELKKTAEMLVKAAKTTPSRALSLSTIDNDLYNEAMYRIIHVYRSALDSKPKDPVPIFREALSKALVYYYPLAGKLKRRSCDGRLQLDCTAGEDGVPFVVADVDRKLSSFSYLEDVDAETMSELAPDYDVSHNHDVDYHPLALQVTRFSCGGFAIAITVTHSVVDGFGAAMFFRALAELASGKDELAFKPVWERDRLVGELGDQAVKIPAVHNCVLGMSPFMPTPNMACEVVRIRADSIKRLKTKLSKEEEETSSFDPESPNNSFTTSEVLGAYIWRSRFRALNLNPDEGTVFALAVQIRHILHPPLPQGYYGNAVIDAFVVLSGRQLNELPLSQIAKLIKNAKKTASNNAHVQNELANMEKLSHTTSEQESDKGTMFLTDWRNLGWVGSEDFGWEEAVNIVPVVPPENVNNLCVLLPPCKMDQSMHGGVRVMMMLPRPAMAKFKEELVALNKLRASL